MRCVGDRRIGQVSNSDESGCRCLAGLWRRGLCVAVGSSRGEHRTREDQDESRYVPGRQGFVQHDHARGEGDRGVDVGEHQRTRRAHFSEQREEDDEGQFWSVKASLGEGAEPDPTVPAEAGTLGVVFRDPRIVIFEDDMLVRSMVAAWLRDRRFDVIEANSADEAVRVVQAAIRIDVVFSDIQMPGSMDGLGLASWLQRERPTLPVILTSGAMRPGKAAALRAHGPILAKPYDPAELERRIRSRLTATPTIST